MENYMPSGFIMKAVSTVNFQGILDFLVEFLCALRVCVKERGTHDPQEMWNPALDLIETPPTCFSQIARESRQQHLRI